LAVTELTEHVEVSFDDHSGRVKREADQRYRLRAGGEMLPTLFTLRAARPVESEPR